MKDEPLSDSYIINFLHKNPLAVISTIGDDGLPYATPVYCSLQDGFHICFLTPKGTLKYRNLINNPHTTLTFLDQTLTETLTIAGTASESTNLVNDVLKDLAGKLNYGAEFLESLPVLKFQGQEKTVMKITPSFVRIRRYTQYAFIEHIMNLDSYNKNHV